MKDATVVFTVDEGELTVIVIIGNALWRHTVALPTFKADYYDLRTFIVQPLVVAGVNVAIHDKEVLEWYGTSDWKETGKC